MRLYRKSDLVGSLIFLALFLYHAWMLWTGQEELGWASLRMVLYLLLVLIYSRQAFVKKYANAASIAERDEMQMLEGLKTYRTTFWVSFFLLLCLGSVLERGNRDSGQIFPYAFFAAAGLLLLLKWLFTLLYGWRLQTPEDPEEID